jgi:hypothetical protein
MPGGVRPCSIPILRGVAAIRRSTCPDPNWKEVVASGRGIRDAVVFDGREGQTDLDAPLDCSRNTDGRKAIFEAGSSEYHGVLGLRPCL